MIYFDNSATTKPYKEVLDTFLKVNESYYANPSSIHSFGGRVEKLIQQSREQIASLLGIKTKEVFFTSGGTESNNLAIKGTALQYGHRGKHIITTKIEHPSVINAFKQLETFGYSATYLDVDANGKVRPSDVKEAIQDDTILVSVMGVNNEIGSVQPIREIGLILQQYPKILFHVDAVQACGKVPLILDEKLIDLCSISAHKIHGIKGTGMLFVRDGLELSPLLSGGEQEGNLRSGTENTGGIVSFAKALRMHMEDSRQKLAIMEENQVFLRRELEKIEGVTVHTPIRDHAPHILNFSVQDFKGEVLIHSLDRHEVYVSTTSACSSKQSKPSQTLLSMGVPDNLASNSVRISLSFHNTMEECQEFITLLTNEIDLLQHTMRRSR
ncbi:cysteine desulfurase family protein [Rossellomorea sp. YZS02]|uniref:cysteine desulfurase family protein n=1 Tax=Rossellomorea sp. YZS02 TaxID=3097358 RepID=UPI002A0E8947|nr:cysteine desulfurase family protein [Rossellomorea sp. YZS02]MDX8345009.1 cysteine desulfurase family protein [Rossellomorea sp. YZS02]